MFKKFLSVPNHSIRVFVKRKRINLGVGYGLEIPVDILFYGNKKAIQWAKITLDSADGNVKKKFLRDLKLRHFEKISYFVLLRCFFWPVRYWEVIFTGIM